eukprot:6179776-Pleurochrysis_carterae.AAC.1
MSATLGGVRDTSSREQSPEAGSCTGAGTCSCSISPAGSSNAVDPVGDAAEGMPTMPCIPRAAAAHGDADADADADVAPTAPPATPAPLSAGRHAATYELQCNRLRQKIDAQRNTILNLEAEIVNLDKKTVRALHERDYVQQEDASRRQDQVQGATEADAGLIMRCDASSDKVTGLEVNITELQRMINRANAAARAANKENAAAVSELHAQVQRLHEGHIWACVREKETKRMQAEKARRVLQEQVNQQANELLSRSQKAAK